jgi:hypothetical protein
MRDLDAYLRRIGLPGGGSIAQVCFEQNLLLGATLQELGAEAPPTSL